MAGHRSPRGRRARRNSTAIPAWHLTNGATAPIPAVPVVPAIRTTVLATAAAVGAVATGTLTALLPTPGDTTTTAAADTPLDLAAHSTEMTLQARYAPAVMSPVQIEAVQTPVDGSAIADEHLALLGKATDIATRIAEEKAEQERQRLEQERIDKIIAEGGLDGWIAEALRAVDLPQSYAPAVKRIIMKESGGNPRAINTWDSNARRGTPSQGLMQTIPSTFNHYVHPDYADEPITHPVANITAGINYMVDTYGVGTLAAGGRSDADGDYLGY